MDFLKSYFQFLCIFFRYAKENFFNADKHGEITHLYYELLFARFSDGSTKYSVYLA